MDALHRARSRLKSHIARAVPWATKGPTAADHRAVKIDATGAAVTDCAPMCSLARELAPHLFVTDQPAHRFGGFGAAWLVPFRRGDAFEAHRYGANLNRVAVNRACVTGQNGFGSAGARSGDAACNCRADTR